MAISNIKVHLDFGDKKHFVGQLAQQNGQIYFQYDTDFIATGMEISPYTLKLQPALHTFDKTIFEGLAGVFNDSLPDGWGRLLFDRFMQQKSIDRRTITPLDRLAHMGGYALGALCFEPDTSDSKNHIPQKIYLDDIAQQSANILQGDSHQVLSSLLALNGSSAGARPKALIGVNQEKSHIVHGAKALSAHYSPWIVKFPNQYDGANSGAIEYVYAIMAKKAGIEMPEVHLFPAQQGAGYFAVKRFDRVNNKRFHMHTVSGLLHADFRLPCLDYKDLIRLCYTLTGDVNQAKRMYRLAVFNVLSHNKDDHAKNFSFLMDGLGQWRLSPAYDLTFSSGPNAEQSTTVLGEGRNITQKHLQDLALQCSIDSTEAKAIIDDVKTSLSEWKKLAKTYGVSAGEINTIWQAMPTG